jgi:hypothetical protein
MRAGLIAVSGKLDFVDRAALVTATSGRCDKLSAVAAKGAIYTFRKRRTVERLVQEADRPRIEGLSPNLLIRIGGYKDHRYLKAPHTEHVLQLQTAHSWHLHIRDNARRLVDLARLEKIRPG